MPAKPKPIRSSLSTDISQLEHICRIEKVLGYIAGNFKKEIPLKEVAEIACLSIPAFCVFFKTETGETFNTMINQLRTEHACRLLEHTDQSISGIAFDSGYSSIANFHRQFKKHKQMPPLKYRQQCKTDHKRTLIPLPGNNENQ